MTRVLRSGLFMLAALATGAVAPVRAQNTPFVPDEWKYGRRQENATLRYCLDARDPDFAVARKIGEAIADALLLEGKEHVIGEGLVGEDLDNLYQVFLDSCDVYLGFKLIADAYPDWLRVTRPYYTASYVLVAGDAKWNTLADMPVSRAIAATMGTTADLRLAQYLMALPARDRWQRFPMSDDRAALGAVQTGEAGAALVWEPGLWSLRRDDPSLAKLRVVSTKPMPESAVVVGAALLANEAFLRASIDQAIVSLTQDGTVQSILDDLKFPGKAVQP